MKWQILFLLWSAYYGNCAKILGVFPAPGRSHYILGSTLLKALAEKGHDVTMISSFGEKEPPKNVTYREITTPKVLENLKAMRESHNTNMFDNEKMNPFIAGAFIGFMMPKVLEATLEDDNVQKLINSNEKFDVVIVEQFLNDAQKALAPHFGAPLIVMSTVGSNWWVNDITGNPSPPSYIPVLLPADYAHPMTFFERLSNSLLYVFIQLYYHLYVYPNQNQMIKRHIPNGPDLYDVLYNGSIVLMNSHPSTNPAVPYVPNMIDIAGFHVKPPKKLPQDLQDFLDNAKDGVIYFSMGSNLRSAQFPVEKRDAILKTFSKLKEKVLWKWEEDVLPGQPANVKLAKWLPQQDILAHPNIKLFITHGGFLSTTETIYHGVPILAIPVFGDQKFNAKNAVNNGFGLALPYSEISEDELTQRIQELLSNPKYRDNVKYRSRLFHDRQVSPMETAIYWIEYVIRHKGAPHLRVAGLDLPWYKYQLVDVVSVLLLVGLSSVFIACYCVKVVCTKLCTKRKSKKVKTT